LFPPRPRRNVRALMGAMTGQAREHRLLRGDGGAVAAGRYGERAGAARRIGVGTQPGRRTARRRRGHAGDEGTGSMVSTGTQISPPVGTENSPPPGSLRGLGGAHEAGLEFVLEPVGIAPDV